MLLFIAPAVLLLACGLRVVREHERLALVRLGRYVGVRGPGLVFIVPGVEKGIRVDLNRDIPGWRGLSLDQLNERVRERASADQRPV